MQTGKSDSYNNINVAELINTIEDRFKVIVETFLCICFVAKSDRMSGAD